MSYCPDLECSGLEPCATCQQFREGMLFAAIEAANLSHLQGEVFFRTYAEKHQEALLAQKNAFEAAQRARLEEKQGRGKDKVGASAVYGKNSSLTSEDEAAAFGVVSREESTFSKEEAPSRLVKKADLKRPKRLGKSEAKAEDKAETNEPPKKNGSSSTLPKADLAPVSEPQPETN